jgi:hypothetical protein
LTFGAGIPAERLADLGDEVTTAVGPTGSASGSGD